jgi:hypothetical protein
MQVLEQSLVSNRPTHMNLLLLQFIFLAAGGLALLHCTLHVQTGLHRIRRGCTCRAGQRVVAHGGRGKPCPAWASANGCMGGRASAHRKGRPCPPNRPWDGMITWQTMSGQSLCLQMGSENVVASLAITALDILNPHQVGPLPLFHTLAQTRAPAWTWLCEVRDRSSRDHRRPCHTVLLRSLSQETLPSPTSPPSTR